MPRFAFSAAMATSGPGCGGTRPCITDRPASAGIPTLISDRPERRATRKMTGISSTRPTSKNIGNPISAPTSAIVQGSAARAGAADQGVDDPVGAAGVGEQFAVHGAQRNQDADAGDGVAEALEELAMAAATASPAIPATTRREPIVSARNACSLKRVTSTTITAMPISAAITRRSPEAGGAAAAWANRTGARWRSRRGLLLAGRRAAGRQIGRRRV